MRVQAGIDSALAIMAETLGHMGQLTAAEATIEKWKKRFQAKEPALTQDEFPVYEAAVLLSGVASRQWKAFLALKQAAELVSAYLADRDSLVSWDDYSVDPQYGAMLVHLSCQAALARTAQAVTDHVPVIDWSKPDCPVCGAPPAFASLESGEGVRKLVCGACTTRWRYQRIGCPFCSEERPDKLKVLTSEEIPGWSATTCLTCRGYLKTADLRQLPAVPRWDSASLDTLPLDYAVVRWLEDTHC